jgi:hypothetical protein
LLSLELLDSAPELLPELDVGESPPPGLELLFFFFLFFFLAFLWLLSPPEA